LLDQIREKSPQAGVRSNFIVGFPGETAADLAELELFLSDAGLDAVGIFGYSDEDGTEAASLPDKLDGTEIARRVEELAALADELMSQRADSRLGENIDVLIEEETDDGRYEGRAAHQAPEVDGVTTITSTGTGTGASPGTSPGRFAAGDMVRAVVTGSDGVDLIAGVNLR
jgi:tRNA A37 methylthiotransferase MiaB